MNIKINDKIYRVKLAITNKEQETGMMKKKFDDTFEGMLFFQGKGDHCFWMKDCIIPLDIIYIENKIIKKIHHNCPPCGDDNCDERYCGEGDLVLELMGNTCNRLGINEGDFVDYVF